jgi:hypothetical protein
MNVEVAQKQPQSRTLWERCVKRCKLKRISSSA